MKTVHTIGALRRNLTAARRKGNSIGFVPTMGAFHDGHLALMKRSREENDTTVVSIFVNPTQFGAGEDFSRYPRQKKKDCLLAKRTGVDIIFYPSVDEMYPAGFLTYVEVERITETLCGKSRPGHFRGVTTVVSKLLNIVEPDRLYLGQKDAQQCAVIRQLIRDLNISVGLRIIPTVREADGLAFSSRNAYLSERHRREAVALYQALQLARTEIKRGRRSAAEITALIRRYIRRHSSARIEYVACVDAESLKPLGTLREKVLIALAVKLGQTRLIDNIVCRL